MIRIHIQVHAYIYMYVLIIINHFGPLQVDFLNSSESRTIRDTDISMKSTVSPALPERIILNLYQQQHLESNHFHRIRH